MVIAHSIRQAKSSSVLILLILGALLASAAELPYGGWIQIPLLSLIWWRLNLHTHSSFKSFFSLGLAFGLAYFVVGLWWLYISLHDVGGINSILSGLAVLLFSLYLALYFALANFTIRYLQNSRIQGLFLAASWVVMEALRGYIFTGFPWMGIAEAQFNGPFAPVAPLLGGLACTFLAIWISWEILLAQKHLRSSVILIASVITLSQAAGLASFTKPFGEPISIRLIQGNFEQSLKFNPQAINQQINFYASQIKDEAADLIVIPETAFPWPDNNLPGGLLNDLQTFSNTSSSNLLLGLIGEVRKSSDIQYSNRATGLSPYSTPYHYDKVHLVPFGEFIPPGFHWFVNAFHVPMSDFARGSFDQMPFKVATQGDSEIYAAITICYEDVFGDEVAARIKSSYKPVNLLINMTNLAWFGKSQASTQQLRLSQLRSLETGLPALRATNTGITAVLGHDGKLQASLPEFTQATLSTQVQGYIGKTPFVIWGNLPILSISCLLLIWGFLRHRRF